MRASCHVREDKTDARAVSTYMEHGSMQGQEPSSMSRVLESMFSFWSMLFPVLSARTPGAYLCTFTHSIILLVVGCWLLLLLLL